MIFELACCGVDEEAALSQPGTLGRARALSVVEMVEERGGKGLPEFAAREVAVRLDCAVEDFSLRTREPEATFRPARGLEAVEEAPREAAQEPGLEVVEEELGPGRVG